MSTVFVSNGVLTDEGKLITEYMKTTAETALAEGGVGKFNTLSGDVKHYWVHCIQMKSITPEAWVEEFKGPSENVLGVVRFLESQQAQAVKVDETAAAVNDVQAEMLKFKEALEAQLAAQKAEIDALRAEYTTLREVKPAETPEKKDGGKGQTKA